MTAALYKVLIVSPTAVLGGAERVLYNVASHLLSLGHDVTFYSMSRGEQTGWEDLRAKKNFTWICREFRSEKTSVLSAVRAVRRFTTASNIDYVFSSHAHVNAMLSGMRKLGLLKCKFLVARESTFIFKRFSGWRRALFKLMYQVFYGAQDLLICQTLGMKQSLEEALNFVPARAVAVIPNPVNIQYIDSRRSSEADISCQELISVVACGRLIPLKGFHTLVRAFARIYAQNSNISLSILGEGPQRNELQRSIEQLGLEGAVLLVGKVSNPYKWFYHADVGVISSEREGFPNVILEMMASGTKRVIATNCTDGLAKLPGVEVAHGHSEEDIFELLSGVLGGERDRSVTYRAYVEKERSLESFWMRVQAAVGDRPQYP